MVTDPDLPERPDVSDTDLYAGTAHQRRQRLIQVATALFATLELEDLTLERVAQAADASLSLVRHYFPTREDLLNAALANAMDGLGEAVLPHLNLPPYEAARRSVLTYLLWVDERAESYRRLAASGIAAPAIRNLVEQVRDQAVRLTLGELYYPQVAETPTPIRVAVGGWFAFVHAAILLRLELGSPTAEDLAEQLVQTLAGAVRAAGDAESADGLESA